MLACVYLAVVIFAVILLPAYVIAAVLLWITNPSILTFITCIVALAAFWLMIFIGLRDMKMLRLPALFAWLTPIAILFYTYIFFVSVMDHVRGGTNWSGRKMDAAELKSLKQA
jgi:hypothetical protein